MIYILNESPEEINDEILFVVNPGENLSQIALELKDQSLIKNYYLFRLIDKVLGDYRTISSGSFLLKPHFSTLDIYKKLISGDQDLISVTIPEGWTLLQIAKKLQETGITQADDFIAAAKDPKILEEFDIPAQSCEGYLFPDTYLFPGNYQGEYILRQFLLTFHRRLAHVYPDWKDFTAEQLHDKIIMASIVEREYRSAQEAPLIASVFYNRLDSWYPRLESCATVTYVITDILGEDHPDRLTSEDISIDNPYNTYENSGLPPGPISNPGLVALNAAFFPEKTDYIYFVLKNVNSGTHNFSSSYDDFMRDKFSYLRRNTNK
jgi:UPF0755 protein